MDVLSGRGIYKYPNATLDVFSVDTDVLVLLTGHYTSFPGPQLSSGRRVKEYPFIRTT